MIRLFYDHVDDVLLNGFARGKTPQQIIDNGFYERSVMRPALDLAEISYSIHHVSEIDAFGHEPVHLKWYPIEINHLSARSILTNSFINHLPDDVKWKINGNQLRLIVWQATEPYDVSFPDPLHPLFDGFRILRDNYRLDPSKVIFVSGDINVAQNKENSAYRDFPLRVVPFSMWERHTRYMAHDRLSLDYTAYTDENADALRNRVRAKTFVCMNARPRPHRMYFVSELFSRGLADHGHVSLLRQGYHRRNFPRERLYDPDGRYDEPAWEMFLNRIPIALDDPQMVYGDDRRMPAEFIDDAYVNIVTETVFNGHILFPTEKIFKPCLTAQPFLLLGSRGLLAHFRDLGYETFPEFFDESYDNIVDDCLRMHTVLHQVERLCAMSLLDIRDRFQSVWPKLMRNRQRLLEGQDFSSEVAAFIASLR
jgi:hypothetical protein